jgi:hypothetical protein
MQTHQDSDSIEASEWLRTLSAKAARMVKEGTSRLTAGCDGEKALSEWEYGDIQVREMFEDEHGILRISVGGGATHANVNYCVFRGDRTRCAFLLEEAAKALRNKPT